MAAAGEAVTRETFKHGVGCSHCNHTGYRGRIGVYELLELDNETADCLRREDLAGYARAARRHPGFRPLGLCALDYALRHETTLDEVIRISGEVQDEPAGPAPESATEETPA